MGFIKNILNRRRFKKLSSTESRRKHAILLLPDLTALMYTIYNTPITLEAAELSVMRLYHKDISTMLKGLEVIIQSVTERSRPRPYKVSDVPIELSLYDFCRVGNDDNYISPDRIVPIVYPELVKLRDLLSSVDSSSGDWDYFNLLINNVTKDLLVLATSIYGVKQQDG